MSFRTRATALFETIHHPARFSALLALPVLLFGVSSASAQKNVTTAHYDNARTGQMTNETTLTPTNVKNLGGTNADTFGKLFSYPVDGRIYAQPLYVQSVTMGAGTAQAGTVHNVVYIATEHDSIYAFDAGNNGGANASPLWQITLLDTAHGVPSGTTATTVPNGDVSTGDIVPEIGITGTPVIDLSTNTMYVVGKTKENGNYIQRLHALDITTGSEKLSGPVTLAGQVTGTGNGSSGGVLNFDQKWENNRPGSLLLNGILFLGFAAHGDNGPWHGWVLAYNAATLQQTSVFCTTSGGLGSGIWMSGAGLAGDTFNSGNAPGGRLFVATGNGAFNATTTPYTNSMSYGDDLVRLDVNNGVMTVGDQFTPLNQSDLNGRDEHPGGEERPARERGRQVLLVVHDVRKADDIVVAAIGLVRDGRPRAGRHDRMQLDRAVLADDLERADPVDRSRRPRERDDDPARRAHARRRCVRTKRGAGNVATGSGSARSARRRRRRFSKSERCTSMISRAPSLSRRRTASTSSSCTRCVFVTVLGFRRSRSAGTSSSRYAATVA